MGRLPSLRRRTDFSEVLRAGSRTGGGGLTIYVLKREGSDRVRLGCVVRSRRAVDRNRIRRRLKAAAWDARAGVGMGAGADVVVRADERTIDMEFQEMVIMLQRALRSLGGP